MLGVSIAEASCSKASFLDRWRTYCSILGKQSSLCIMMVTFSHGELLVMTASRFPQVINSPPSAQRSIAAGSWRSMALSTAYNSGRSCLNSCGNSKKYSTATAKNSGWLVPA